MAFRESTDRKKDMLRKVFRSKLSLVVSGAAMVSALTSVSCQREKRVFEPSPPPAQFSQVTQSQIRPGAQAAASSGSNDAENRAYDVNEGKRLFTQYNCSGCHANGGGGMGPPLMDEKWIYGSEPVNIYSTIIEGRPNGMPSFRNKVPDSQVWQLAAFVRSLSGQLRKDVSPSRSDDMMPHKSEQASEKKTPQNSTPPQ
jgi:cytochrome c oxidase cbb3-type subunit III